MEYPNWLNWLIGAILFIPNFWFLFTRKTIPEVLADIGLWPMKASSPEQIGIDHPSAFWGGLRVISMLIGLAILILLTASYFKPNEAASAQAQWSTDIELVQGKTFRNEIVILDGKNFLDCTFENATLLFKGNGPVIISGTTTWRGRNILRTDNRAASAWEGLVDGFKNEPKLKLLKDQDGNR